MEETGRTRQGVLDEVLLVKTNKAEARRRKEWGESEVDGSCASTIVQVRSNPGRHATRLHAPASASLIQEMTITK